MNLRRGPATQRRLFLECEALEGRALMATTPVSILSLLPTTPTIDASTVPANGDVNPYGVAFVPRGVLVSNFNNSANQQGTGTTILRINKDGTQTPFFQGQPRIGLTGALGVLKKGFVLVGSVPTTDGTSATVGQGSLLIINRFGKLVGQVRNAALLDGPWGMAVNDHGNTGQVFISNVLSGTVTRLGYKISHGRVQFTSAVQIGSGYAHRTDPAALVVGPAGLVYNPHNDTLYVASTGDNEVFAIPHASVRKTDAGQGRLVYQDDTHLHGPIGLTLTSNGDFITANGDAQNGDPNQPSELVEFTPTGQFVNQLSISDQQGAAFGVGFRSTPQGLALVAVNDVTNSLEAWIVPFTNDKNQTG